jgi:hypothetical protein
VSWPPGLEVSDFLFNLSYCFFTHFMLLWLKHGQEFRQDITCAISPAAVLYFLHDPGQARRRLPGRPRRTVAIRGCQHTRCTCRGRLYILSLGDSVIFTFGFTSTTAYTVLSNFVCHSLTSFYLWQGFNHYLLAFEFRPCLSGYCISQ